MARQTEVVLFLILATAVTSLVSSEAPLSAAYFDKLVQDAQQRNVNDGCSKCCPYGWTEYKRRCYKYHASKLTWGSAEKHCLDYGGHLISIHDINDYHMVKSVIRAYDSIENPTWIGLSRCQKGDWLWSDGSRVTFTKWNPGEPNRLIGECCAHMNYGKHKDWNNIGCKRKYASVCVKNL